MGPRRRLPKGATCVLPWRAVRRLWQTEGWGYWPPGSGEILKCRSPDSVAAAAPRTMRSSVLQPPSFLWGRTHWAAGPARLSTGESVWSGGQGGMLVPRHLCVLHGAPQAPRPQPGAPAVLTPFPCDTGDTNRVSSHDYRRRAVLAPRSSQHLSAIGTQVSWKRPNPPGSSVQS